jgi:two-component sensor histidine kinase
VHLRSQEGRSHPRRVRPKNEQDARVAQPTEHGFGLTLIERRVGHALGGVVRLDFAPEDLSCEFLVPYTPENFRLS